MRHPSTIKRVYHALRGAVHRGNRVQCPCCGGRFRGFLPFGLIRRENAQCPRCGSLERHRLLWLYLERATDVLRSDLRLLHVAPEPVLGDRLEALPRLRVTSVDLGSPLAMVRADLTRLSFRDRSFDVALCLHVLEHVPDDRAAMRELGRVLEPGGWAILQSPFEPERATTFEDASVTTPAERERVFGQSDHVRIYGRDYVERLREEGFEVEEISFARALAPEEVTRFGVLLDETITRCTRPGRSLSSGLGF